jgi:phenylalanyl-tRNA synthetase beta chain
MDYVDLTCSADEFAHEMTMTGTKAENIIKYGEEINNVVIGKIISIARHPSADKLVICKIDIGGEKAPQIVTGAKNVYEGAMVPVALNGATLAGGLKIKTSKLRGELSEGMLCSIEELGYSVNEYPDAPADGIYILNEEVSPGADARDILKLREDTVEFEITSNRADCNSMLGIAREAAATFKKTFSFPETLPKKETSEDVNELIDVEILNAELCPRYIARIVKNVKIGPSPLWLRQRLITAGLRPINNIVDITNYVMLEVGQPMHAFDIDSISFCGEKRKIIVRNAKKDEKFITLDGAEHVLDETMLVIADSQKAIAVAGVMGGENSKVTENATAVLFESANFNGTNVRLTSKKLNARTDASSRYEKGLDPNLSIVAVNRAVKLVEELGCGETLSGMNDCYPSPKQPHTVKFRPDRINKIIGADIPAEDMYEMLSRVEISVSDDTASVPTFRPDIELEEDIAEEIARFYGYDRVTPTLMSGAPTVGKKNLKQKLEDSIRDIMTASGFYEALTYSFESPKVFDKLNLPKDDPARNSVVISNPLGEDFSVMRATALNGILQALSINYNRRNNEAALYELCKIYKPKALLLTESPDERNVLVMAFYGIGDFFTLKGVIERIFDRVGIKNVEYAPEKSLSYAHPGRCASITKNSVNLGFLCELHPVVAENYKIDARVYIACVNADFIYENADLTKRFEPLPKFPSVTRDVAVIVQNDVTAATIEKTMIKAGGKTLRSARLFDVYKGENIEKGFKSLAYALNFRAADRTLTDEEVLKSIEKILASLEKVGAKLRDH